MNLIDLNRHEEIGANSHFIQLGDFNLLVDAGLHPKRLGKEALPAFEKIKGIDLDFILLTHCHLDHLGSLPIIARQHPKTPIITSFPNTLLAPRMLRNSVNVMKRQRQEHGLSEYPLFLHRDIAHVKKMFIAQRFKRNESYTKKSSRIEIILHPSGHVAGASAIEIVHNRRRIVFSGDVLFEAQRTLPGAHLPEGEIDTLILETTRGATAHSPHKTRTTEINRLLDKISEILDRGGSCLIPVFALGRMQEIFKIIHEGQNLCRLKRLPVFAAGLGMDLCKYFEKIRQKTNLIDFDAKIIDALGVKMLEPNLHPGRNLSQQGIYIVSSGMMVEHTPSYHLAASLLPHSKNGLCFVGYCDPETPGGELLARKDESHFFFKAIDYRARIEASIDQFELSGHANRQELASYAEQSGARSIVLAHGDQKARNWFTEELGKRMPQTSITNPKPNLLCSI